MKDKIILLEATNINTYDPVVEEIKLTFNIVGPISDKAIGPEPTPGHTILALVDGIYIHCVVDVEQLSYEEGGGELISIYSIGTDEEFIEFDRITKWAYL